jgi:dTDP-4-amino-4,6-dideoxygalactose transaminase
MSWVATLNAIHLCGAVPVFVDVNHDQLINPDLIESAISKRTRAILPVHFTGRLCDMERIGQIARAHRLLVIEDAAQSYGARRGGIPAGGFADAGAFSLNPMKTFPAFGEAGAVVTDDPEVHDKIVSLRYLGTLEKEVCHYPSLNHKIDELQAAMMLVVFDDVEKRIDARLRQVERYNELLRGVVKVPRIRDRESVFFDYQIYAERRDELRAYLANRRIETKVKHPLLMDEHPAYSHLKRCKLPVARRLVKEILSLPLHEYLSAEDQTEVAQRIHDFYSGV